MNGTHGHDDPRFVNALSALARHPNAAVICALSEGARRQAELVVNAGGLNEATLGSSLRELDGDGFISRRVDPGPPLRVLYELTPLGEALATSLRALREWASHHA
jgi:DNA-binding HxlR family transcriptional regulator